MYLAYKTLFQPGVTHIRGVRGVLEVYFPWLPVVFPTECSRTVKACRATVTRVGGEIIERKKREFHGEKAHASGKDILSLLFKSNMLESSVKDRLSDDQLITQISTLLFVGSDTTSTALDWVLHMLSLNPDVQQRLREELLKICPSPDSISSSAVQADIIALPYLEHVIKETLRLIPPAHGMVRVAAEDCVIPTSDSTQVFIRKGQFIHIAIEAFNTRKDAWGEDAFVFRPERWASVETSRALKQTPGVVAGLMTFSMGSHSCPGHQFSMLEMKALLASIIPAFVFEQAPGITIGMYNCVLNRPFVKGDRSYHCQMPLVVRPYNATS